MRLTLPTHLAHALKDDFAVVDHALGTALAGQRQNGGEFGGLLDADFAG